MPYIRPWHEPRRLARVHEIGGSGVLEEEVELPKGESVVERFQRPDVWHADRETCNQCGNGVV